MNMVTPPPAARGGLTLQAVGAVREGTLPTWPSPSVLKAPSQWMIGLLLLAVTIATRLPWLGDPLYHDDEGFYLAFAEAMHRGAIPYVDVWDRKPFGLFLIYWLTGFLPGSPVIAYQLVAGACGWGTAVVLHRIARPLLGDWPALGAACLYLTSLLPLFGAGGQAPVFYNLPIACAVLALADLHAGRRSGRHILRRGAIATTCCGLALTIKPTVIVESVFLGNVAAYHLLRSPDLTAARRWLGLGGLVLLGVLPTLAIFSYFGAIGRFDAYWFATVQSMSLKLPEPGATAAAARYLAILLFPLWAMSAVGLGCMLRTWRAATLTHFLIGWTLAAIGGFLLVPDFWDHHAQSLLPPFTILAGALFARARLGVIWALIAMSWTLLVAHWPAPPANALRPQFARLLETVDKERHGGCLFVFDGPAVLYPLSHACQVTSRIFPQHLGLELEKNAIGMDPAMEMHRILQRRPAVITMTSKPIVRTPNLRTRAILLAGLHAHYRLVARMPITDSQARHYLVEIWRANPSQAAKNALESAGQTTG